VYEKVCRTFSLLAREIALIDKRLIARTTNLA
jgi:hypothetical protein